MATTSRPRESSLTTYSPGTTREVRPKDSIRCRGGVRSLSAARARLRHKLNAVGDTTHVVVANRWGQQGYRLVDTA